MSDIYKVIVFGGDEAITKERENKAVTMKEAIELAVKLFKEHDDGNYPDLRVDIYPIDEYVPLPTEDYPVVFKDSDGALCKGKMKVGTYCRVGLYRDVCEMLEEYKLK